MRKLVLLFIIFMAVVLLSGLAPEDIAQRNLNKAISIVDRGTVSVQINTIIPGIDTVTISTQEIKANLENWTIVRKQVCLDNRQLTITKYTSTDTKDILQIYLTLRDKALAAGGRANLTIKTLLPVGEDDSHTMGHRVFADLGAHMLVQEITEGQMYSGATYLSSWGPPLKAGGSNINLQLIVKPYSESGFMQLVIVAPDLAGDI